MVGIGCKDVVVGVELQCVEHQNLCHPEDSIPGCVSCAENCCVLVVDLHCAVELGLLFLLTSCFGYTGHGCLPCLMGCLVCELGNHFPPDFEYCLDSMSWFSGEGVRNLGLLVGVPGALVGLWALRRMGDVGSSTLLVLFLEILKVGVVPLCYQNLYSLMMLL